MAEALAFTALSAVIQTGISYMFPSEGPRMKDLKVTASTYGNIIPETWGIMRTAGNMIWATEIRENKEKKRAGKGGSYYNQYTYEVDFAMGFSVGPVDLVRRIWADGKIVYDVTGNSEVTKNTSFTLRIYKGDEEQTPDTLIVADKGELTPAYRGLCYCVFEKFLLADFGNRIPQMTAEVYRGDLKYADQAPLTYGSGEDDNEYTSDMVLRWGDVPTDFERGYFYGLGASDQLEPSTVIRRFRTTDSKEELRVTPDWSLVADDQYFPDRSSVGYYAGSTIQALIGMTASGGLIAELDTPSGGSINFSPFAQLDPVTLEPVAAWGIQDAYVDVTGTDPMKVSLSSIQGPTCQTSEFADYYLHVGIFQHLSIFRLKDASSPKITALLGDFDNPWNNDFRPDQSGSYRMPRYYCAHDRAGVDPVWYSVSGAATGMTPNEGDDHIRVFKIGTGGWQTVYSFPNPRNPDYTEEEHEFFCAVSGCFVDHVNPGLCFFWRETFGLSGSRYWLTKISLDTYEVIWEVRCPSPPLEIHRPLVVDGEFGYVSGDLVTPDLYVIDTITGKWKEAIEGNQIDPNLYDPGELTPNPPMDQTLPDGFEVTGVQTPDPDEPNQFVRGYTQVYDGLRKKVITIGGNNDDTVIDLAPPTGDGVSLGFIVETLLRKAGMRGKDFQLGPLYEIIVKGYGFARVADVKAAIQELKQIYLFDLVESDGRLVATVRGGEDAVRTIKSEILGGVGEGSSEFWRETRTMEGDLPMAINFSFFNSEDDYETSMARAKRQVAPISTMFSPQTSTFEANIVFDPTEAKQRAHKMLYTQWGERNKHEARMPWAHVDLDPSDLINVDFPDGRQYFERIHTTEFGANLAISFDSYSQDNAAYVSEVVADGGGSGNPPPSIPAPAPALPFFLNVPLLRDSDSTGGAYSNYYTAVGKNGAGTYTGATFYYSANGIDYTAVYSEPAEVEWGLVEGTVPPAALGDWALDYETRITIRPQSGVFALESINDDVLDQGGNLCIVGDEVMQFRDCVENPNGSWTIYNLWRGRRGTEYACDRHRPGEKFVFPDAATFERQGENLSSAGQNRWVKAAGGNSLLNTPPNQQTYWPRDLMPYAPTDIRREFISSGDCEFTWQRRTRLGGGLMNLTPTVPLNETAEAYEVYILDGPYTGDPSTPTAPTNVLRMLETTQPRVSYTPAMMAADGVTDLDTLYVVIYQISGAVGRGFPGYRAIEPWRFW